MDSPRSSDLEDRLASIEPLIKPGPTPSQRIREKKLAVNGLLAVSVLYRNLSSGWEVEYTLIPAGAKTFMIACQEGKPGPIESQPDYIQCVKMRDSFRLQKP